MYQKTRFPGTIIRLADGACIPTDPSNTDYAAFLKWEADGGVIQEFTVPLETLKAEKLNEINQKAEATASLLTSGYPEFEMKTWPQQESESMAWQADSSATTPMIDIMAAQRGIDRVDYLNRTLVKATIFREKSSKLVGQRQKFEDQLKAATTAAEVAEIDPVYVL